ncbi:MAG TPA: 2-phosphosulfolactate phosphatase, partial [Gemmatimonadaceae bacterium]|nr:2-phosphosulfolactate phosphatase [Gemmatimonadaceae bacterium]
MDVVFAGAGAVAAPDVVGRVVAVIDVLRASSSIAAALANGARAVIPVESSEEVITRAKNFERGEIRLAGERKMLTIPGFDLGNSPREFTRAAVDGRTILMATTNGTPAITNTAGARDVVVASYVNYTAVLTMLRAALRGGADVTIVCAGRDRQFALEDAGC